MTNKELNVKVYPNRVKRTVKHLKSKNELKRNKRYKIETKEQAKVVISVVLTLETS